MKRYIDKETGEEKAFGNIQVYVETENTNESQFLGNFDSFKQILEHYEDYIPAEPLIKDEKIRKFVRAWAEVNGFNVLKYLEGSRTCELSYRLKNSDGDVVMELLGGIDGLENCKEYSITELCGEEEE